MAGLWVVLFCGGAMVTPATGVCINAVPAHLRSFGSAMSMFAYNLLGYAAGSKPPAKICALCDLMIPPKHFERVHLKSRGGFSAAARRRRRRHVLAAVGLPAVRADGLRRRRSAPRRRTLGHLVLRGQQGGVRGGPLRLLPHRPANTPCTPAHIQNQRIRNGPWNDPAPPFRRPTDRRSRPRRVTRTSRRLISPRPRPPPPTRRLSRKSSWR